MVSGGAVNRQSFKDESHNLMGSDLHRQLFRSLRARKLAAVLALSLHSQIP